MKRANIGSVLNFDLYFNEMVHGPCAHRCSGSGAAGSVVEGITCKSAVSMCRGPVVWWFSMNKTCGKQFGYIYIYWHLHLFIRIELL
jgi:hypothetical protein